jgi:hypothetical protein
MSPATAGGNERRIWRLAGDSDWLTSHNDTVCVRERGPYRIAPLTLRIQRIEFLRVADPTQSEAAD